MRLTISDPDPNNYSFFKFNSWLPRSGSFANGTTKRKKLGEDRTFTLKINDYFIHEKD
jgi:hypothetical protein